MSADLQRTPREQRRDPTQIVRVYHHHSGALGASGFAGLRNSARFVVTHRSFPGPAYTFWLPFAPEVDDDGRLICYRAQPDDIASWHTGAAANQHGVAVSWQGNLSAREPSPEQYRCAEQLCAYLESRYRLDPEVPHSFHAEASRFGGRSKRTCPGPHVRAWVEAHRASLADRAAVG